MKAQKHTSALRFISEVVLPAKIALALTKANHLGPMPSLQP